MSFTETAAEWLEYVSWTDDDGFVVADDAPDELRNALDKVSVGLRDRLRGRFFVDALTIVVEHDLTPGKARAQAGHHLNGPLNELFGEYVKKCVQERPEYLEEFGGLDDESLKETARELMTLERRAILRGLSDYYADTLASTRNKNKNEVADHE